MEEWVSLDGYVADKDGQLNFFTDITPEQNTYSDNDQLKFLESVDLILLGRKTYELFVEFWPTATTAQEAIADRLNELPKVVFSNTLKEAPWGKWKSAEVISGDAIAAIKDLKSRPGKNMVLWGSISLTQALIKENMIDEYHIQLCPVLTGGGRRLFEQETDFSKLMLSDMRRYDTGLVLLNYKPAR